MIWLKISKYGLFCAVIVLVALFSMQLCNIVLAWTCSIPFDKDQETTSGEVNMKIASVLESICKEGFYVIDPQTRFLSGPDNSAMKVQRDAIARHIGNETLVDTLFWENVRPSVLGLKSNDKKGYHIDNDGKYRSLFQAADRKEWLEIVNKQRKITGIIGISVPAYDERSGLLLVYVTITTSFSSSKGCVYEYSYKNGQVSLLKTVVLWTS